MISLLFILIAAGIAAHGDAMKITLRSNDQLFGSFIASICMAIVTYEVTTNAFIDFLLYFGAYTMTFEISFIFFKRRNNLTRRNT